MGTTHTTLKHVAQGHGDPCQDKEVNTKKNNQTSKLDNFLMLS